MTEWWACKICEKLAKNLSGYQYLFIFRRFILNNKTKYFRLLRHNEVWLFSLFLSALWVLALQVFSECLLNAFWVLSEWSLSERLLNALWVILSQALLDATREILWSQLGIGTWDTSFTLRPKRYFGTGQFWFGTRDWQQYSPLIGRRPIILSSHWSGGGVQCLHGPVRGQHPGQPGESQLQFHLTIHKPFR